MDSFTADLADGSNQPWLLKHRFFQADGPESQGQLHLWAQKQGQSGLSLVLVLWQNHRSGPLYRREIAPCRGMNDQPEYSSYIFTRCYLCLLCARRQKHMAGPHCWTAGIRKTQEERAVIQGFFCKPPRPSKQNHCPVSTSNTFTHLISLRPLLFLTWVSHLLGFLS